MGIFLPDANVSLHSKAWLCLTEEGKKEVQLAARNSRTYSRIELLLQHVNEKSNTW